MKTAIIIGASSGIGRELAKLFSRDGYVVGVTARRLELLTSLQAELPQPSYIKVMDVRQAPEARLLLEELIEEMGGVDVIVVSAGTGYLNLELDWGKASDTIQTNVDGFVALANAAMLHFIARKRGHLVGITSLAALRGSGDSPVYYASKAFQANYLQGLRKKATKLRLPITVSDVQPGLVDTAMAKGDGLFWVATAEKAAQQIYRAIQRHKKLVVVTKRWRLIAWLMKTAPDFIYNRV
jgi:short-subunit dehydrogenase